LIARNACAIVFDALSAVRLAILRENSEYAECVGIDFKSRIIIAFLMNGPCAMLQDTIKWRDKYV